MNQTGDCRTDGIGVSKPAHEIGTGVTVASCEMAGHGFGGAPRQQAERGGVENRPFLDRRKFSANFLPIGHRGILPGPVCTGARLFTMAAASATGTSADFLP